MRSLCTAYVEVFRNVPLLLQLFIWYFVLTEFLPPIDEALQPLPGVFFSKNGLQFPIPVWEHGHWCMAASGFVAWHRRRVVLVDAGRARSSRPPAARAVFWPALAIIVAGVRSGWLAGGAPTALDMPEKTEINVVGGGAVTPEFLTVLIGLDDLHGGVTSPRSCAPASRRCAYGQTRGRRRARPQRAGRSCGSCCCRRRCA